MRISKATRARLPALDPLADRSHHRKAYSLTPSGFDPFAALLKIHFILSNSTANLSDHFIRRRRSIPPPPPPPSPSSRIYIWYQARARGERIRKRVVVIDYKLIWNYDTQKYLMMRRLHRSCLIYCVLEFHRRLFECFIEFILCSLRPIDVIYCAIYWNLDCVLLLVSIWFEISYFHCIMTSLCAILLSLKWTVKGNFHLPQCMSCSFWRAKYGWKLKYKIES